MTTVSPPREWIDPLTKHRVIRLSDEPGSSSLYFNFNGYTPQGDYLIISTPTGLSKVSLANDTSRWALSEVIRLSLPFKFLFVGHKYRRAYYQLFENDVNTVHYVDIDSGASVSVARIEGNGDIQTINCDETLLGGVETDPDPSPEAREALRVFENRDKATDQFDYRAEWPDGTPMSYADAKEVRLNQRLEARVEMKMFVISTETGQRRDVYGSQDWLNHLLFSPTDPSLLMFCHEGNWHCVDRLWLLRLDNRDANKGLQPVKIHHRTMNMEIAGHEWFSRDGKTIWYDLQTPRGQVFWVAGYDISTGTSRRYHLEDRNHWSVHYHHHQGAAEVFCGDGGDQEMVAHATDAKYLYLYRPKEIPDVAGLKANNAENLLRPGYLEVEKLVDMRKQDYRLEPNAHFTPDGKWVVFRGNMEGGVHTYAVEVERAE